MALPGSERRIADGMKKPVKAVPFFVGLEEGVTSEAKREQCCLKGPTHQPRMSVQNRGCEAKRGSPEPNDSTVCESSSQTSSGTMKLRFFWSMCTKNLILYVGFSAGFGDLVQMQWFPLLGVRRVTIGQCTV